MEHIERSQQRKVRYFGLFRDGTRRAISIGMTTTYPIAVAREVAIRRPDLSAHDAVAATLTADPTLTADEVIAILDEATDDWAAETHTDGE